MIEIGKYQDLAVRRFTDFGAYLGCGDDSSEVLLPARYVSEEMAVGSNVRVFVYRDSEDRPVATTEKPFAVPGEFAFLSVTAVNDVGAFLDWSLPKDLLVPYSEQKVKMRRGGIYLVYVYVDKTSGRIVASAKTEKFLDNVFPDYKPGQKVQALVTEHVEIGYKVIVDNLHRGIIYANEIYHPVEIEQTITAFVKQVRTDGKIDLTLSDRAKVRVADLAERIMEYLLRPDAVEVSDRMSPSQVEFLFECSKKDFKKALGQLYREHRITLEPVARPVVKP